MKRRRRAPIASTVTTYRFATPDRRINPFKVVPGMYSPIGTRERPQRVEQGVTHSQPLPTRAERDQAIIAKHGGHAPTHSTSWDQDN